MNRQQRRSWELFGYVRIDRLLVGEQLRRTQAAFGRALSRERRKAARSANGKGGDIRVHVPKLLDADPAFVDLVDHPKLLPVLKGALADDLVLTMAQGFAYPPAEKSFTGWHSDLWHFVGADLTADCYFARAIIYLSDVAEDGGCFAYVAGSHRWDPMHMVRPPAASPPEAMPNHVRFAGPAGTAVVFNAYGLHTALPNHSDRARWAVQLGYVHAWVPFLANSLEAYGHLKRRATTPTRRQLFRLDPPDYNYDTVAKMILDKRRSRALVR